MNGNHDLFDQPPAGVGAQNQTPVDTSVDDGTRVTSPCWAGVGPTTLNAIPPVVSPWCEDCVPGDIGSFGEHD